MYDLLGGQCHASFYNGTYVSGKTDMQVPLFVWAWF